MNDYLLLFRGGDAREAAESPERYQEHMGKWMKWMEDLGKKGAFVAGEPLGPEGKTISGSKKLVTDGPFTEGKEIVGGYLIIKAGGYDDAVQLSKECPIFEYDGVVEVREIQKIQM